MRPPLHFKQKDAFGLQCRMWTRRGSDEALARIAAAAKAARLSAPLEDAIAEELLIELAGSPRGRPRNQPPPLQPLPDRAAACSPCAARRL